MADMKSPEHPLEVLPAMLNLVLVQTGKILRDPEWRNSRQIGLTRRRINDFVPTANQRFHDALDEIEIKILHARAVFERDLSIIRKRRAERDRAAGVLKDQNPPTEETKVETEISTEHGAEKSFEGALTLDTGDADTTMPDLRTITTVQEPSGEQSYPQASEQKEDKEDIAATQKMPQDSENSAGLAITIPSESLPNGHDPPISSNNQAGDGAASAEAPLQTPNTANLDFESMFNDTDLTVADDAMNFELGFNADGNLNDNILNDPAFDNMAMSNQAPAELPATTNEDINSLLPGLENYVNAGSDFTNIAMPNTSTLPADASAAGASATSTSAPTSNPPVMADTNFDDLFAGTFSMDGVGDNDMAGDGSAEFQDFDDDWFKTDQS